MPLISPAVWFHLSAQEGETDRHICTSANLEDVVLTGQYPVVSGLVLAGTETPGG